VTGKVSVVQRAPPRVCWRPWWPAICGERRRAFGDTCTSMSPATIVAAAPAAADRQREPPPAPDSPSPLTVSAPSPLRQQRAAMVRAAAILPNYSQLPSVLYILDVNAQRQSPRRRRRFEETARARSTCVFHCQARHNFDTRGTQNVETRRQALREGISPLTSMSHDFER
jgi:hypothetical protein